MNSKTTEGVQNREFLLTSNKIVHYIQLCIISVSKEPILRNSTFYISQKKVHETHSCGQAYCKFSLSRVHYYYFNFNVMSYTIQCLASQKKTKTHPLKRHFRKLQTFTMHSFVLHSYWLECSAETFPKRRLTQGSWFHSTLQCHPT